MIELLILFELNRSVLTMYGISKEIRATFAVLTTPSYGTIKPALTRLENGGFVKKQKTMSKGGRPSCYYSITKEGVEKLKHLIMAPPPENPIQFFTSARVKLACSDCLNNSKMLSYLLIRRLLFLQHLEISFWCHLLNQFPVIHDNGWKMCTYAILFQNNQRCR